MKLSSWDKQLVLALPRECAASQSDQTINPSKNEVRNGGGAGCKSPLPHLTEGRGDAFLLDILFHRMSVIAIFRHCGAAVCFVPFFVPPLTFDINREIIYLVERIAALPPRRLDVVLGPSLAFIHPSS